MMVHCCATRTILSFAQARLYAVHSHSVGNNTTLVVSPFARNYWWTIPSVPSNDEHCLHAGYLELQVLQFWQIFSYSLCALFEDCTHSTPGVTTKSVFVELILACILELHIT
jgi:hypothetical protein